MTIGFLRTASVGLVSLLAAAALTAPALADGMPSRGKAKKVEPAPEQRRCTLSANVGLASEYVFRGFSQTSEGAAIQGGFDVTCGMLYAGVWASNLDWGPVVRPGPDATWASIELDVYAGLKGKLSSFTWDLGVIYYTYPNSTENHFFDPLLREFRNDYVEIKAGIGAEIWKNGTLGVTAFYSPDYQYETGDVWTVEVGFSQAFSAWWGVTPTFSALIGHQWGNNGAYFDRIAGDDEYTYWNIGLALGFLEKWSLDLRYWDTDLNSDFCSGPYFQCDERFVATLKFTY